MLSLLSEPLEHYVLEHSMPESELHGRLRDETQATLNLPQMQVGALEGGLLRLLVQLSGARRVLEVGTFSGYSGLCIASGLPKDGKLTTCDIDPVATEVAQRYFEESPWADRIELRLGPALETISELAAAGERFDMAFIDADKENYVRYWDAIVPMMPIGSLLVVDNTLWGGAVLDPKEDSDRAIVAFNTHAQADPRVEQMLLPIRDGVTIARKIADD
jgi:caffeoyl-CoA O-methyltransferase